MSTTEHPDWPAFLAAIVAEPDDDTARLVAADFLQEYGDADRAAFIRVQVELARLEAAGEGKSLAVDTLRAKERAFLGPLSMFRSLWAAEACPELVKVNFRGGGRDPLEAMSVEGADRLTWRRGFVEGVRCTAAEWLHHGVAVRKRNPIRRLDLGDPGIVSRDAWYAMLPALTGLRQLWLGLDDYQRLATWLTPNLPGVQIGAIPF
jgi:uncharacterized protein (TIGR02996 family)